MTSPMLDAAIDLLTKQEFSIIPVRANKRPLFDWAEFQSRRPTEEEVEHWWATWPDANIAIVTGAVSGLVVADADGPAGLVWMKEHLPRTGVYVRTGKGWHGYYRHPGGEVRNRGRIGPEVDIRADGGYVVAPPSVHASGQRYEFQFTPGLGGWDGLADYALKTPNGGEAAGGFAPALLPSGGASLGIDLSGVRTLITPVPVPKGQRNDTLTRLAGQWVQKGLDLETCLLTALGWNALLPQPLPADEVRRTVESVIRTDLRNHPDKAKPDVEILEEPGTGQEAAKDAGMPPALLQPGGLMQLIMDYTRAASAVSHPVFSLAGAMVTLGTLVGQKFQTETGLRTNLYCIALGYSGAGKDSPQAAIPQILNRTRACGCVGPNALTSEAAILRWLSNEAKARSVFFLDEIGLLLQGLKRPNSPAQEVPALLMKLFSSTNRGHIKPYASGDNIEVKWHHMSFYGASTPDRFWDSLTRGEATDGFLARCLVFESRHDVERPRPATDTAVPPVVLQAVNDLHELNVPMAGPGNLQMVPAPIVVPKSDEAAAFFEDWSARYHELRNKFLKEDEGIASIYGRAAEHAHKIALIHAASLRGPNLAREKVELPSVQWACALVDYLIANMIRQIEDNLAESEFHKLAQRVMKAVRRYCVNKKKPGAPRWLIENSLKGTPVRVVNEVLAKLENEGSLAPRPYQGKAGPATIVFCPARRKEEE